MGNAQTCVYSQTQLQNADNKSDVSNLENGLCTVFMETKLGIIIKKIIKNKL